MNQNRSNDDFELIFKRHYDAIYQLCKSSCGNESEAEDLTQEAFRRACRAYSAYTTRAPIRFWLRGIARNVCIDWAKAQAKSRSVSSLEALSESGTFDVADNCPLQDEIVEKRGLFAAILRELQNVDPMSRLMFLMIHYEGMDYADVAQRVGLKTGTVKSRASRLSRLLKTRLAAFASDPPAANPA